MAKSAFIDFKAVKSALNIKQVLEHYGLLDGFTQSGDNLSGPCPIHKGTNATQFRVSLDKNLWHCFADCKRGGNALDLICRMEDVSVYAAASKAIEWFGIDAKASSVVKQPESRQIIAEPSESDTKVHANKPDPVQVKNTPLKFKLEKLEKTHPYLQERGITLETMVDFGIGFCSKGLMAGRIAIPIHNLDGEIVAYCGRYPGTATGEIPKYKLPQGFHKSLELFNVDRAVKETGSEPLIIVEGFFDCMMLHQLGHKKVVALMGSTMSGPQEELIRRFPPTSRIIVALDEDDAGRAGRDDIASRLCKSAFVKVHTFSKAGQQPESLTKEELAQMVGGAR